MMCLLVQALLICKPTNDILIQVFNNHNFWYHLVWTLTYILNLNGWHSWLVQCIVWGVHDEIRFQAYPRVFENPKILENNQMKTK